ncbi:GNAT family N-acetyltransferase [Streptomyces cylindrosporus]|uniref:GNAT family N-acetyltransferase n=1 Tax=Streptomyces cylindrosporus TaxID=2927583 RepID=A0ABS9YB22_9ACTN|nr:GNAT family N-acetyltransferase [Streptomyces cylindrosporus]MCI3273836.1 GNAT family N-acetyltransferase [Streptomyces cylindrosporus]
MEKITARLTAAATPSAPALVLRPWTPADAAALVALDWDDALRRWTTATTDDEASATRWIGIQQEGWEAGHRFAFAVVESPSGDTEGRLAGHMVLKIVTPGIASAEVGYWTAAHARGRGVAPRALEALTEWAFTAFPGEELTRLELLHQEDNTASCRVAEKTRYALASILPASPPAHPHAGHVHVRTREI